MKKDKKNILELLKPERSNQTRDDLKDFCGKKNDIYLELYDEMSKKPPKKALNTLSFSWGIFFAGPIWFFYRKMRKLGLIYLIIYLSVNYAFDNAGWIINGALMGTLGESLYIKHALAFIAQADKMGLKGQHRQNFLKNKGGTSKWVVRICVFIFIIAFIIACIASYEMAHMFDGDMY